MMADKTKTGREGEAAAKAFLQQKGYKVLHTNWRFHHYELDIVAVHDDELVIVEVKTRSEAPLLDPEAAVNEQKILRTVAAADAYMRKFEYEMPVRFDLITVLKDISGYHIQEHIEDAFFPPCL